MSETETARRRAEMVQRALRLRSLPSDLDPAWLAAISTVPRHEFAPEVFWHESDEGRLPLGRVEDETEWLGTVYGDNSPVAQVDDGRPSDGRGRLKTCTMTGMYDLGRLLPALPELRPGMRVCEIGTGTGYTAALLAHRLGGRAGALTTVEVDPGLARAARRRLHSTGYHGVTVVTGDGAAGYLAGAPYDLLVSTATVHDVPYEWVRQVRPGGTIVTAWSTAYEATLLLRLTVTGHGTAVGSAVGHAASGNWLRAQRPRVTPATTDAGLAAMPAAARTTRITVDYDDLCGSLDIRTAIGLRVPGCTHYYFAADHEYWFTDVNGPSWVRLQVHYDRPSQLLTRYGPRNLWREITAAHDWWYDSGRPGYRSWQFTVTPQGTHTELPTVDALAG